MYTNPTTTCSDDNPEQSYQCRFIDATERIFRPEKNSLVDNNSVHRLIENENSGNNSDTSEVAIKITNDRGAKKLTAPNFSCTKRSSSPATLLNEDTNKNARSRKHEGINNTEQGANSREQQSVFVISDALSRPPGDDFKVIDGTQTVVLSGSEEESSGVFPSTNEELNRNEDEASRHRFLPKYQHKDVQEALSSLLWQPYEYQQRTEEEIRRQAESSSSEEEERGEKRSSNCSTTLYDLDGSPSSSSGRSASTSSPSPAPNKGEEEAEEEMVNNLRRSPHHNNNHQHCGGRHNAASSNARSRDSTSCCYYYCSSLLSLSASDATARSRSRLNCAGDQALAAAFSLSKSSNGLRCGSRGGDSTSAKSQCVGDAGGSVNGKSGSTRLEPTNQCDESCDNTTSDEAKSDMQLEIASSPPLPTQKSTSNTVAADSSTSNSAIINDNQNSLAVERNNVLSINTTTAGCCPVSSQDYNNSSLPQYHQQHQQQKNVVATAEAAFASGGTATSRASTTTNILNEISRISPSLSSANVVGLPRRALSSSVPSSNNIIGCTTNNNTNRHSSGGLSVLANNNINFAGNHPRHGSEPSFSSYNNNNNNNNNNTTTNSQFNHSKFFGNQQAMVVPPLPQRTTSTSTTAAVAGGGGGTITATTTNRNNNLMISHMKSASVPKSMYIHHQSSTGSSGSNNCQQRTTQDNNVNSSNNTQLEQNLANNNVSNVNVNFYRAVPANVVCSSTVVPTIQCLNTINHDEGGNNVSNVHIMPLCNNNSNNMQYHPSSTSNINGTTLTNSIIANNNNGSSQGNSQSNTACNNSLLNSTFHQTVVPTATTQTLPTTGSTNVSSNCQSNLQYLTSSNAPSGTFQQTVVPATGIIGTTQVMVHNNKNQSTVTQISSTTASVGTTSGQFGQQNSLTPSRTVPNSQTGVVPKTYASTEAQTEETSVGCSNITAQSTSDCSRLISNSNGTGTPTAIDNARAVPIRRKERRIRQRKRRPNYHSHGTTGVGTSSSSFNNNRQAVVNQQQQQQTSSINSGTALPLNNNLSYNDRLPDLLNSHLPPPYTSVLSNNAAPPNVVLPAVPPQHHQQQGNQMLLHSNQHHHHHPGHPQLVHQTSSGLAPPHVLPVVPPPNSVIVPNGLMGFPGPPPPGQAVPLIHHHHHHQGGGGVPGPVVPIAVPPPPPPSEFRFSFPAGGFRRGRYSEELPKNCCGVLTWKPGSLRWFIAVIALIAVCCVLVGTILGAMRPAGRDHLTVSLLMIGVGIVLVTVSGIAWRLTSRNNSTNGGGSPTITCRSMFRGLRHSTSSESVNDVITGNNNNNNNNNSSSSSCPRRFIPRLASAAAATATAPSYGRPHHPYAAMMYPEFQYRPPPPSYQASMQEYRLRLLLLERGHTPQIQVAGQGLQLGGCVVSPPPTYRSHAGSLLRAPLSNGRGDTCQSEYSCPPSYRSQTSLARPSIGGNSSINDHQQTNSVLFQHQHHHHQHAREQSLSLSVSSSNNNYCEPIVNVVNILASSDDDIVVLDDMTLDALKMDAENNGSEDVSTLKMLLNNSSTEGARELDTSNTNGKEGNLVTIVQTNDQNPIIVTVSGSSQMESNNNNNNDCNNGNSNAVQIGEISSEMEILAHL